MKKCLHLNTWFSAALNKCNSHTQQSVSRGEGEMESLQGHSLRTRPSHPCFCLTAEEWWLDRQSLPVPFYMTHSFYSFYLTANHGFIYTSHIGENDQVHYLLRGMVSCSLKNMKLLFWTDCWTWGLQQRCLLVEFYWHYKQAAAIIIWLKFVGVWGGSILLSLKSSS